MENKILTIRVKQKKLSKGLQQLAMRHGFKWNDGICKVRDCGENPHYLQFDFPNGTITYLFEHAEPADFIQFKDSYEIENEFDNPPELIALKRAFQRYQKEIETVGEPLPMEKPKPVYYTWKKKKGEAIQHFHNMKKCIDEI